MCENVPTLEKPGFAGSVLETLGMHLALEA